MDGTMSPPILGNNTSFARQGSSRPSRSYLGSSPCYRVSADKFMDLFYKHETRGKTKISALVSRVYVVPAFRFFLHLHASCSVISDDSLRRFFFIMRRSTIAAIPCLRWETGRNGTRVYRTTRELSENTDGWSNLRRKAAETVAV